MTNEAFYTLHRHWIWCQVMKDSFDKEAYLKLSGFNESVEKWNLSSRHGAYKSVWYGLLFSVLDVLKKSEVEIKSVQKEIDELRKSLYDFRNAVFHPQPDFWHDRILKLIENEVAAMKIQKIHEGLAEYFEEELFKRKPAPGSSYRYECI